jgi:osmotically-inducible protein OsmY
MPRGRHYSGMRTLFAILLLAAWSWTAGAATTLTKSHSQGKFSDAEIEATIKAKLAKSKIGKDGFQVHVKDGVATWTGTTSVMQHKGSATRMAKTAGAIKVVNNIKVSEVPAGKATGAVPAAPRHVEVKTAKPNN